MARRTQNDNFVRIEQGKAAAVALAYTRTAVAHLTENIVGGLVAKNRSGNLTDDALRGGIGEITGLRNLIAHFENQVAKGHISTEEEVANADKSEE